MNLSQVWIILLDDWYVRKIVYLDLSGTLCKITWRVNTEIADLETFYDFES